MTDEIQGIEEPFRRLVAIMERLLGPGGCPWDREQTHESLIPYLLEEAYEVKEDVLAQNWGGLQKELGDVALQVVFHAALAKRDGRFDIDDVMESICEKLIRRHPHVFGKAGELSTEQVLDNWEQIKKVERQAEGAEGERPKSLLDGVPETLPALQRAQRVQEKAANVGFDWERVEEVWAKVDEEYAELREAFESGDPARFEDEMGDLLFALVNLSRFQKSWAEIALGRTIARFMRRFRHLEEVAGREGRALDSMTLAEMDALWDEAKRGEDPSSRS